MDPCSAERQDIAFDEYRFWEGCYNQAMLMPTWSLDDDGGFTKHAERCAAFADKSLAARRAAFPRT